jgi:hypothetical protein
MTPLSSVKAYIRTVCLAIAPYFGCVKCPQGALYLPAFSPPDEPATMLGKTITRYRILDSSAQA